MYDDEEYAPWQTMAYQAGGSTQVRDTVSAYVPVNRSAAGGAPIGLLMAGVVGLLAFGVWTRTIHVGL